MTSIISHQLMRFTSILQKPSGASISVQLRDYTDEKCLLAKYELNKNSNLKKKLKWDEIKEAILLSFGKNANKKKVDEMRELLEKFKLNTRSIISEDVDGDTISDAAYFLFQIFYYKDQEMNENYSKNNSHDNLVYELNKTLTQIFPLCSKNLVEKMYSLIETILSSVQNKSQIFDKLFNNEDESELMSSHYGLNVDYIDPTDIYKNSLKYPFPTDLDSFLTTTGAESNEIKFDFPTISNETKADELDQIQLKWVNEIDTDVVKIVYELLNSSKSNDELQNELLETIGFEKFDLIGYLLSNRVNICKSYKRVYIDVKGPTKTYASTQPIVGKSSTAASNDIANVLNTEIVVHTKSEKQIKKLIRKEEKKLNKFTKTNQGVEFENVLCDDLKGLIDADQNVLRKIREEQLTEARLLHLYNKNRELLGGGRSQPKTVNYPFVFDRLLQATQTMAHIAGAKILLPEDIQRVDNKQYEQIFIPAVNAKDSSMDISLIDVNTLDDDIGKIAFRNVKYLNRIQSIVFQSAYTSNENLLICAPTGFTEF